MADEPKPHSENLIPPWMQKWIISLFKWLMSSIAIGLVYLLWGMMGDISELKADQKALLDKKAQDKAQWRHINEVREYITLIRAKMAALHGGSGLIKDLPKPKEERNDE
tara:strand:- start:720 stop:1046 length:327 start_codon:yes stop_codon:yes gene_type:complete